jgi:hypothetical protein
MLWQASLPDEKASHPLQVETYQDVASRENARFLWTGLGLAVLMLIGASACVLHSLASHSSAEALRFFPDVAFTPVVAPGLANRGMQLLRHSGSGRSRSALPALNAADISGLEQDAKKVASLSIDGKNVEKLSAEQHPKHIAMSTERLEDAEQPLEAETREALATGAHTDVFTELLGAKRPVVKLVEMQCPVGVPAQSMSDALMEAGALYVSVSDGSAGTLDEHPIFAAHDPESTLPRLETWSDLLEAGALWSNSTFEVGFDPKADVEGALLMAGAIFGPSALPRYTISDVETRDWVTEVQANWPPIVLPGCLTIRFPWHTDADMKAVSAE